MAGFGKIILRGAGGFMLGVVLLSPSYSLADDKIEEIKNEQNAFSVLTTNIDSTPTTSLTQANSNGVQTAAPSSATEGQNIPVLSAAPEPDQQSEIFPEPQTLKPNVDFWMDMYTKYTEKQAVIHDNEDLDIRYEVVDLSQVYGRASRRYISRQLTTRKKYYSAILAKLAKDNGECATAEECRVASLFGNTKDGRRYKDAQENLRAQYGLSNRFRDGLITSGRYMDEMRRIFAQHGLPQDLVALPHVESSFNVAAYSRVGAAGIWQFMRSTGRHFMKINNSVDERRDPLLATDAAARFLKSNYSEIGSWPLTVISYNHGKNGIMHAKRNHGDNVVAIIRNYHGPAFGFASRNFYTEFLAARKIMLNPEKYFGPLDLKSPLRYATIKVDGKQARKIASSYGINTIAELNPGLHKQVLNGNRPLPAGYVLRIPEKGAIDNATSARVEPASMPEVLRPAPAVSPSVATYNLGEASETGETGMPENMTVYVARRGDTLSTIAKKFRTTVADIKDFNELRCHRVRAGQKLFVPKPTEAEEEKVAASVPAKPSVAAKKEIVAPPVAVNVSAPVASVASSAPPALESFKIEAATAGTGVVRVKSEESLGLYASWASANVQDILRLNKWKKNRTLALGKPVTVPLTNVSKEKFEENRLKYHQKMLDGFFASFSISGVDNRVLRRGQTIWNISSDSGDTPMWLLAMYNQDKKLDKLHTGETVRVPVVRKKLS